MSQVVYDQQVAAYRGWRDQNSQRQLNNEFRTIYLLRNAFPSYHVTEANVEFCDVIGYAKAGHATVIPEDTAFNHFTRSYNAPDGRFDEGAGELTDQVRFGSWRYRWRGTEFLIYKVMYTTQWGLAKKLLYILHEDGPNNRNNEMTDALIVECGKWSKDLHGEIYVFDNTEWKKSKELWRSVEGASWDDVILEAGMKERLINDVENFFDTRKIYQACNVPWKRGVILHGVPGNGKTVSVKALINSLAEREKPIPALYVKSLDACQGPKYSIQLIFKRARLMAPCLLVFEDLDSLVTPKTRSYFLNEIDGLESNNGILMIGSTNYLDRLDPSITKRPSRFDRKYHFKLPDEEARLAYTLYWSRKFEGPNDMVDFPESICPIVAKITDGFSFAYLKELFIASLLAVARGDGEQADAVAEAISEDPAGNSPTTSQELVIVGKDGKTDVAGGSSKPVKKPQAVLAPVEIPEDLKENVLLRAIMAQAKILLHEMENASSEPHASVDTCEEAPMFSPAWFSKKAEELGE